MDPEHTHATDSGVLFIAIATHMYRYSKELCVGKKWHVSINVASGKSVIQLSHYRSPGGQLS